jgi:hypothetical protein
MVGKKRYLRNVKSGNSIPLCREINKFCGLPIGVIMLPIVIPNANEINIGAGRMFIGFASPITMGVATRAIVSLMRNAAIKPITNKIKNKI